MTLPAFSLQGKRALITGGGTGIGFAIARAFIHSGARVLIVGRRKEILAEATALLGASASFIVCDLSNHKKIPGLIQDIETTHGPIDILVNNAGKHLKKKAQETSDEDFLEVIRLNVLSVFALTRCCAEYMLQRRQGCVLMISSMTAFFGVDRVVAYGTSKTALTGMINGLVTEYSTKNIRVNAIAPGWIETDIFSKAVNTDPERKQKIINRIAMDNFGKPEDIAYAAVYLCSDAARYVTGVVLPVDGGAAVNM